LEGLKSSRIAIPINRRRKTAFSPRILLFRLNARQSQPRTPGIETTFSFMRCRVAFFTAGRRRRLPVTIKFWEGAALKNRAAICGESPGEKCSTKASRKKRTLAHDCSPYRQDGKNPQCSSPAAMARIMVRSSKHGPNRPGHRLGQDRRNTGRDRRLGGRTSAIDGAAGQDRRGA
jgi:hypothetical protein